MHTRAAQAGGRCRAFSTPSLAPRARPIRGRMVAARVEGSTPFEKVINGITVALKNSPINAGKIALAKAQAGEYDEAAIAAKIRRLIDEEACVVFSWAGCPFCKRAKALLREVGASFKALELDDMGAEGKAMRAELAKMTGRTSVPNIWIGGENVGGCNDGPGVMTLQTEGRLVPLLQKAGALSGLSSGV